MNFTFGIITTGNSDLRRILYTIYQQGIPEYQIIVVGGSNSYEGAQHISFNENEKSGWITRKKNIITEYAEHENIVYMHDYIELKKDWYQGFMDFGDNFKICMNRILNIDGSRFRDWTLFPAFLPEHLQHRRDLLLPYDLTKLTKYQYISGAYWVAKKSVMCEFPLDETLCWGFGEDVEWSHRVKSKYKFSINTASSVQIIKEGKDIAFSEAQPDIIKGLLVDLIERPKEEI